jgi:hypothetical protein
MAFSFLTGNACMYQLYVETMRSPSQTTTTEDSMEKQTTLKKIAFGLAGLVFVALIGYVIFQNQQIKKLSQGANSESVVVNGSTGAAASGKDVTAQKALAQNPTIESKVEKPSGSEVEELSYQLDASEEELDLAHKKLSDEQKKKAEFAKNAMALQKKMFEDPATKKMIRDSNKAMLDSIYGPLFKDLNLPPETLEKLKDLLVDQQMTAIEKVQDMLGAAPSEAKKKELQQQFDELKKTDDIKLGELLGNKNLEKYNTYKDRLSERQLVTNFIQSLGTGDKLTEAQQQVLVDSMYQERKNVFSQKGYDEKEITLPSEMNEQGVAKLLERTDNTFEGYVKSASATLSSAQTQQFKTYLKQQRDLTESAMKLTSQMFGAQTTQTSDDKKSK